MSDPDMFDHGHENHGEFVNPIEGINWEYSIDNYPQFAQLRNETFVKEI